MWVGEGGRTLKITPSANPLEYTSVDRACLPIAKTTVVFIVGSYSIIMTVINISTVIAVLVVRESYLITRRQPINSSFVRRDVLISI